MPFVIVLLLPSIASALATCYNRNGDLAGLTPCSLNASGVTSSYTSCCSSYNNDIYLASGLYLVSIAALVPVCIPLCQRLHGQDATRFELPNLLPENNVSFSECALHDRVPALEAQEDRGFSRSHEYIPNYNINACRP